MTPLTVVVALALLIWFLPGGTEGPTGYVDLCKRLPDAPSCTQSASTTSTNKALVYDDLREVNVYINEKIKYVPDVSKYQTPEYWTAALGEGDCEDYVLAKMQELLRRGWPLSNLRIAVTEDHALLYARLNGADYVLDNTTPVVWESSQVKYAIRSIQSEGGSNKWVPWYQYAIIKKVTAP